jgi:hypothetical protein
VCWVRRCDMSTAHVLAVIATRRARAQLAMRRQDESGRCAVGAGFRHGCMQPFGEVGTRTVMTRLILAGIVAITPVAALSAQGLQDGGETGKRRLLPRAEEIALARSAAPPAVSDSATVWVLTDSGYVVAVRGSSGAACFVSRDWIISIEPHCFDREGAETIMPMSLLRVSLLHRGWTKANADRAIADSIASGHFRLPRRPAMSYMMSAAQRLVAPNGTPVGAWHPHLMIYYPYLTAEDVGAVTGNPTLSVEDAGKPTANITVMLKDFVQVRR